MGTKTPLRRLETAHRRGKPRNAIVVTNSLKRQQTYHVEGEAGMNRLIGHQRADGSLISHAWDGYGRLAVSLDPLEQLTRIGRDVQGNITRIEQARASSRRQYDKIGRIIESQDPDGATTRYQYGEHSWFLWDELDVLSPHGDQLQSRVKMQRDPLGCIIEEVPTLGQAKDFARHYP